MTIGIPGNPPPPSPSAAEPPASRGWTLRALWIDGAIILLAFLLRIVALDNKPLHFDEGVNGWFVDSMTLTGSYHYDPGNFHGPLHFYVLFLSQTLLGRTAWALRLPIAVVSTLAVALTLGYRRFLPVRACRLAALAMAISPGCVFYGRYSIHESWMLLFLLLATWGLAGLWQRGGARELWAAGLGLSGMILTKETYAIHVVSLLLAVPSLLAVELVSASAPLRFGGRHWTRREVHAVFGVSCLLIFFFYTGALLDWSSLPGLWQTFQKWGQTGLDQEGGHVKNWHYFLELIARYEWPALLGLAGCLGLALPRSNRVARYLAIYGLGALTAYSLIAYKTPWCVIVLLWPFYLVFGWATDRLMEKLDRWTAGTLVGLVLAYSLAAALLLNFRDFVNDEEPYVYVQTRLDINELLDPLQRLVAVDRANYHLTGHVLVADQHPLAWLLADFPQVDMLALDAEPAQWDSAFVLIDDRLVERAEAQMTGRYFKKILHLRGNSNTTEVLYLNETHFAFRFPGQEPNFIGPAPAPSDLPAVEIP